MQKREINFGIIGCGLMGREFASAVSRWCHLLNLNFVPKVVGVCDKNPEAFRWFESNFSGLVTTTDHRALISRADIEAVYCAVPHNLHTEIYVMSSLLANILWVK